jgi:hypothetical protein
VAGGHADRVEGQPAPPDLVTEPAGGRVEGQGHRAVGLSRVAGGHRPGAEQGAVGVLGHGRPGGEVGEEPLVGAAVVVAQGPGRLGEVGLVAVLEQGVAGVAGQGPEQRRL